MGFGFHYRYCREAQVVTDKLFRPAYSTLPEDKRAEHHIVNTMAYSPDDVSLWKIVEKLEPEHFLDVQARVSFKKMKDAIKAGRTWIRTDFPVFTDSVGAPLPPISNFQLEEMPRRLHDAAYCRNAYEHA